MIRHQPKVRHVFDDPEAAWDMIRSGIGVGYAVGHFRRAFAQGLVPNNGDPVKTANAMIDSVYANPAPLRLSPDLIQKVSLHEDCGPAI
ncbi:hypothetical protein QYR00_24000 (plasmid) [Agrobacterium tumefaciens]|nr:hypothetical protein QYR00_24000 [Agrobacterium tumefaciens]